MEDGEESLKHSSILKDEHVDMHEVVPQPMHNTTIEKDDSDEDNCWCKQVFTIYTYLSLLRLMHIINIYLLVT